MAQTHSVAQSLNVDSSPHSYAEKSINSVLDYVSASPDIDTALMQKFYDETNKSLAEAKNEVCQQR